MRVILYLVLFAGAAANGATIAEKTAGMKKFNGFCPLYWDEKGGNLFLEIERVGEEFLFCTSLAAGSGSNNAGLDRGQIGQEPLMRFDRIGPKVLLVERNLKFHAISNDAAERRVGAPRWRLKTARAS